MNARLSLLLAAALAAGCSKNTKKAEAEAPPVTFTHQPHLENDVACDACHAGIAKSTKVDASNRDITIPPKSEVCSGCHDPQPKVDVPARGRDFTVSFDHAAHLPRVGGDCKKCHTKLPEPGMKERPAPAMAACTGCHNHQQDFVGARCTPCHRELRELRPETAFAHVADWGKTHAQYARPDAQTCAACHDQTYCAACHSATTAPARPSVIWPEAVDHDLIHRGDYVSRHMVDAGASPASCRRCHGSQFCEACHASNKVAALGLSTDRDPHPAGWATNRASGHFHGDAARANIVACAGCHDQGKGSWCVRCHAPGGIGGNPHPPGWGTRHDLAEATSGKKPCLYCHL